MSAGAGGMSMPAGGARAGTDGKRMPGAARAAIKTLAIFGNRVPGIPCRDDVAGHVRSSDGRIYRFRYPAMDRRGLEPVLFLPGCSVLSEAPIFLANNVGEIGSFVENNVVAGLETGAPREN